ncbi:MAG: glycosyl transferase [Acidimicrobiales bacterium]|nr:glycosyl transferase [Acidimicrobiales bacterium]
MRVLHLAPLWHPVARDSHGGIETLLAGLLAAQQRLGCDLTLVASGDSHVAAGVGVSAPVPVGLVAQMGRGVAWEYEYFEQEALALAVERATAAEVDVVHSHIGAAGFLLSSIGIGARVLHTWHNDVTADLEWFVSRRPETRLTTVSESQASRLREHGARRCEVVPNGIAVEQFPFRAVPGPGLAFLGRMEPDKGPDLAIAAARAAGRPLVLAGPIVDHGFFAERVLPGLGPDVHYAGVLGHDDKVELLGRSSCVLVPSRYEEAFGLVAVEAMACGTPAVGLANGALGDVIDDDVTGFTTTDAGELADLVLRADKLDRAAVRARAEERFSIDRTAARYLELYAEIAEGHW